DPAPRGARELLHTPSSCQPGTFSQSPYTLGLKKPHTAPPVPGCTRKKAVSDYDTAFFSCFSGHFADELGLTGLAARPGDAIRCGNAHFVPYFCAFNIRNRGAFHVFRRNLRRPPKNPA